MERLLSEAGVAAGEAAAADEVPQSCSAKARRHPICRTCGWTKDPGAVKKCKCCPGSPQAEAAVAAANAETESAGASKDWEEPAGASASESYLSDAEINKNMRDNMIPKNSKEFPDDDPIRQSVETPIACRKGSKKPKCKGNKGVKAKKRDRQKCRARGGKVLDRNERTERCETDGGIQMQPITHDGDSDNRGTMPQRNPGIAQRAANLEAAFGSSEHKKPHATAMATPSCARVVGPNRDIYYAEVNKAGDDYTGKVTRDVDNPMCRPKASAAAAPAAEPASESESDSSQPVPSKEESFAAEERMRYDKKYPVEKVLTKWKADPSRSRPGKWAFVRMEDNKRFTKELLKSMYPWGIFTDEHFDKLINAMLNKAKKEGKMPTTGANTISEKSSEESPSGNESKATGTIGSCRRTTDAGGRSYFYNRAGESAWSGDSSVCHRPMDCFTLNYTLTLNKVF
jgi:hypothetical protein